MKLLHTFSIGICFIGAIAIVGGASAEPTIALARIVSVKAMPYYPETGAIRRSTSLFDKRLVLRNIVMPADGIGDPLGRSKIEDWDIVFGTTATYVEVDLESLDFSKLPRSMHVELRARTADTKRELTSQSVALSTLIVGSVRALHVPFFVYGTGCEKLEIRVRLLDGSSVYGETSTMIPFSCGE
jgi:hypothetical protein